MPGRTLVPRCKSGHGALLLRKLHRSRMLADRVGVLGSPEQVPHTVSLTLHCSHSPSSNCTTLLTPTHQGAGLPRGVSTILAFSRVPPSSRTDHVAWFAQKGLCLHVSFSVIIRSLPFTLQMPWSGQQMTWPHCSWSDASPGKCLLIFEDLLQVPEEALGSLV